MEQEEIIMNQKLNIIFSRRSVRQYHDREVPDTMMNDLLEAAMAAPSAVAKDPWHFIVLKKRESLDKLADVLTHGQMLRQATAAFVVCGDITEANGGLESYMLQDLSAAVENILLAANALGLGTCWLGVHPRPERMEGIRKLFALPDNIIPMCGIAVGWPKDPPPARTRFNPDKVHREKW
jgi:nitroreductase